MEPKINGLGNFIAHMLHVRGYRTLTANDHVRTVTGWRRTADGRTWQRGEWRQLRDIVTGGDSAENQPKPKSSKMGHHNFYRGGKGNTFHKIINLIPPHDTYIESHLGGGAVMRNMRPAQTNIGIDINADVIAAYKTTAPSPQTAVSADTAANGDASDEPANWTVSSLRVVEFADGHAWQPSPLTRSADCRYEFICADSVTALSWMNLDSRTLIYADPPYYKPARAVQRDIYANEYTRDDHIRLLKCLRMLPCMVLISGYYSDLYADLLHDWHTTTFQTTDIGGNAKTEWLWANYKLPPTKLHDYGYAGDDFRERERIKKKKKRWARMLRDMPAHERGAVLEAIKDEFG